MAFFGRNALFWLDFGKDEGFDFLADICENIVRVNAL
jgi:hypothetical protein